MPVSTLLNRDVTVDPNLLKMATRLTQKNAAMMPYSRVVTPSLSDHRR